MWCIFLYHGVELYRAIAALRHHDFLLISVGHFLTTRFPQFFRKLLLDLRTSRNCKSWTPNDQLNDMKKLLFKTETFQTWERRKTDRGGKFSRLNDWFRQIFMKRFFWQNLFQQFLSYEFFFRFRFLCLNASIFSDQLSLTRDYIFFHSYLQRNRISKIEPWSFSATKKLRLL